MPGLSLGAPAALPGAVAKAVTAAYLSSSGNAFSTRTASQIVQQSFNPGESNAPSGPLFGVQFSQLPCSDFMTRFQAGQAAGPGPRRSPLGLSADPGGFPLYKNGVPVGGIGVATDPDYTLDPRITDRDRDQDEMIALAGTFNLTVPQSLAAPMRSPPTARLSDVSGINYAISVKDGVVYLAGIARSEAELRRVTYLASDMNGTKLVKSFVQVPESSYAEARPAYISP